jgi:CubicO group peptidase (beta-lactamase class C family)
MKPRGGPAGMVLHEGRIVAEWGDIDRVDLTYSATKSYLSVLAGIALERGLIADIDHIVSRDVQDSIFHTAHNSRITWRQLLQQTSELEGTLWGIPDTVDWNRAIHGVRGVERETRKLPGEHWEYNDVRVNALALALLGIWKAALPDVLKREVMDPIGATSTWEWHGYGEHSMVDLEGRRVESVSGGAHWGGGLWISTCDHARFGLLFLNDGCWDDQRIVPASWIREMIEPCDLNPQYGYLWWLNTGHARYGTSAATTTFAAEGAGGNCVVVEPEKRLVIVTRWCDDAAGVTNRVAAAFA